MLRDLSNGHTELLATPPYIPADDPVGVGATSFIGQENGPDCREIVTI